MVRIADAHSVVCAGMIGLVHNGVTVTSPPSLPTYKKTTLHLPQPLFLAPLPISPPIPYRGRRNLFATTQTVNPMTRYSLTTPTGLIACDVKIPFVYLGEHKICEHPADFNCIYEQKGNMLEYTDGFDTSDLNFVALKTAEVIHCAHSEGRAHGNVSPGVFYFDGEEKSVTLLDVDLYGLAQEHLDRVRRSPSHHFKARKELVEDNVVPSEIMDIHSWGKSMTALYSRKEVKMQISNSIPGRLRRPQEMPEAVWKVVEKCLDENLELGFTNMGQVVEQLAAVVYS